MKTKWQTKDGTVIPIKDLTDSHLLNIIAYLLRTAPVAHEIAIDSAFIFSSSLRGEMAQYYAEGDCHRLTRISDEEFIEETIEQWPYLLREAKRRQLQENIYEKAL